MSSKLSSICLQALAGLSSGLVCFAMAHAAEPAPVKGESEDPFDRVHAAEIKDGQAVQYSTTGLPATAFSRSVGPTGAAAAKPDARAERPLDKIHPELALATAAGRASVPQTVVITFREDMRMPRFPEPETSQPKDAAANVAARERAAAIVDQIKEARRPHMDRRLSNLRDKYGAQALETFWLVNAATVRLPASAIAKLARDPDVLYIEPAQTNARPPDTITDNDVDDGRARMTSDPYFNLNQTSGWIGLLDTGIRPTHVLFNSPSHIAIREDCTSGTCRSTPNPNDDCWNHGTSTAAIITGNSRLGNPYRGVTGITLDSFKVYPAGCGGLNTAATLAAFQRAVAVLDRVIVAEMQGGGNEQSSISLAADNAFNAGAVVIAANGNNGPNASTVNSPANAHKVIGVGNFDVRSLTQVTSQSRGPAADGRIKPDVQTPTNTETASNTSDTALRVFTGTSGATPYAAGAAALVRNFLRGTSFSIDPGQVYSFLILAGQTSYPFNNTSGTGRVVLPTNGSAWWGKVTVTNGAVVDIPISVGGASPNTFDAALWWPETATQAHNDVDVSLIRPNGTVATSSISSPSVFERVRVAGPVTPGTWKLRLRGFSVPTGSQTVYWAAHVRR
jgi:serine protease AprX